MILLNIFMGEVLFPPFYKWGLSGYEGCSNLPKSTYLVTEKWLLEPKAKERTASVLSITAYCSMLLKWLVDKKKF